ncbi:hypothetical protein QL285_000540 [Trifolium repens]|nr:hypothetical protein QL285_000540 [Trifolium repens]
MKNSSIKINVSNRQTHWKSAIVWISSNTALARNKTTLCSSSMSDFAILKGLNISIHPPKSPVIKEIFWKPPPDFWIKCNTDGAATSTSSACGGIFRNHLADFIYCFAENTGLESAFHAELCGVMRAFEIAASKDWSNLWLETDSTLVVQAFNDTSLVPWRLRNRWFNCSILIKSMNLIVSHIYREDNTCADGLANIGLSLDMFTFWYDMSDVIRDRFISYRQGRPNYRFVNL